MELLRFMFFCRNLGLMNHSDLSPAHMITWNKAI